MHLIGFFVLCMAGSPVQNTLLAMASSNGDAVISKKVASHYTNELDTGKHRRGGKLSAADKNFRINKLKAYSLTLSTQFRFCLEHEA